MTIARPDLSALTRIRRERGWDFYRTEILERDNLDSVFSPQLLILVSSLVVPPVGRRGRRGPGTGPDGPADYGLRCAVDGVRDELHSKG